MLFDIQLDNNFSVQLSSWIYQSFVCFMWFESIGISSMILVLSNMIWVVYLFSVVKVTNVKFNLQKKSLQSLYDDKLKVLVEKLLTLDGDSERYDRKGFCFHFIHKRVKLAGPILSRKFSCIFFLLYFLGN